MSLPERLGRLQRLRRLGVGGFASVWLYQDPELESPVAVKALADNWSQRHDIRERFLSEARILRRAENDHVVRIYDVGEIADTPYFVMTYADRGSVADTLVPDRPLSPEAAAMLIRQAGAGLAVLHQHGVIHRDIKPSNLLLRTSGDNTSRVLVSDLGAAKAMINASGLTQVIGTPAYMAPEQARGFGIDLRADVHGLGAVAYQLLTGRLARTGEAHELLDPRLPEPPSRYADIPRQLDAVVLRALEPDADARWPDVLSFTGALDAAVRGGRSSAYTDSPARQTAPTTLPRLPAEPGPAGPPPSELQSAKTAPPADAVPTEPRPAKVEAAEPRKRPGGARRAAGALWTVLLGLVVLGIAALVGYAIARLFV